MMLIQFQEGFFDDVKNRVQRNLGNMADAASSVVNKVNSAGQSIKDTANNINSGINKFRRFVGPAQEGALPGTPGSQRSLPAPQLPTSNNSSTQGKTVLSIKKQTSSGATGTTAPLS